MPLVVRPRSTLSVSPLPHLSVIRDWDGGIWDGVHSVSMSVNTPLTYDLTRPSVHPFMGLVGVGGTFCVASPIKPHSIMNRKSARSSVTSLLPRGMGPYLVCVIKCCVYLSQSLYVLITAVSIELV